jgi:mRNA interferase MazF
MNYYKEPRRGDIFYITHAKNLNNGVTLDTAGRPGVIVSSNELNKNSDYIEVVYLTTQPKKPMPTHTSVYCKNDSTALCETIHTIEKGRLENYVRTVSDEEMDGIEHGLNWSLGLYKEPEIKSVDDFEPGLIKLTKMDTDSEQVQKSIQLSTERDMYKKLYEDLLAQVIK